MGIRIACALLALLAFHCQSLAATVRVGLAVSLKEAVTEIASAYQAKSGDKVEFTYGSSGQILAQIKAGAAIDVFVSAADKQVDELVGGGFAVADTRRVIAGNTLVLILPADAKDVIDSFESLRENAVKRFAIGEPKNVPAGQYAMQALESLHLTAKLREKLVYGSNVRQVLDYVARGEVTAGLVYSTDVRLAGDKVKVVAAAPKDSHDPIAYTAIIVKDSKSVDAAKRFLDHLATDDARRMLLARGFTVPDGKP